MLCIIFLVEISVFFYAAAGSCFFVCGCCFCHSDTEKMNTVFYMFGERQKKEAWKIKREERSEGVREKINNIKAWQ